MHPMVYNSWIGRPWTETLMVHYFGLTDWHGDGWSLCSVIGLIELKVGWEGLGAAAH